MTKRAIFIALVLELKEVDGLWVWKGRQTTDG